MPSIVADRVIDAVLSYQPKDLLVLLALQERLLTVDVDSGKVAAAKTTLEKHLALIRPAWVQTYGSAGTLGSRRATDLLSRVDAIRNGLGQSASTWNVLGGRMSRVTHRRRLFCFWTDPKVCSETRDRPAAEVIRSFVGPALFNPRDPHVFMLVLAILDYTSPVGILAEDMTTHAERKAAIEGRTDDWSRLLAEMPALLQRCEDVYDETREASKGIGEGELAKQLYTLGDYPEEVLNYLRNMHLPSPEGFGDPDVWAEQTEGAWEVIREREGYNSLSGYYPFY